MNTVEILMSLSYPEIFSVIFSSFSDLQLRVREPMGVASNSGGSSVIFFCFFFIFFKILLLFYGLVLCSREVRGRAKRGAVRVATSDACLRACVRMN